MPSWELIQDNALPMLLYLVLPALVSSALIMAVVAWLGGAKQAAAGAAIALCIGAFVGLWVNAAAPSLMREFSDLPAQQTAFRDALQLDASTWNRLPWAILAVVVIGRLANIADGWLVRGGAVIAIAWCLLPDADREQYIWMTPAFAVVIFALWEILDRLAVQPGSGSVAVGVVLSLVTASEIMLHAHSARLMGALTALGFAFAGLAIIACWRNVDFRGAIPAVAVALPSLLLMGQRTTISKLPWYVFALPVCAPILLAATLPFAHWPKLRLHLMRLALVLTPLAVAVVLAWLYEPDVLSDDWSE
jgi:hypothetical protein